MNTLAFDTCFGACSVGVTWSTPKGHAGAYRIEQIERGHAERLMPMISDAMSEAPFGFDGLDRIIVTTGPGTFTGQRVGIAAARALSLATGAPVVSLTSLAVMAHTAVSVLGEDIGDKVLAVAVDARRGELYLQAFAGAGLAPLGEPVLTTPEDAARGLGAADVIAVGSGGEALADARRAQGLAATATLSALQPDVRYICDIELPLGSALPRPLYLRPPDAKPQDGAAFKRVS
ncbi:MAG TPA: tRNA (adenosine(37)-N6)-threonylcarbamoyltransferase complex dimerization subunit type 1 TsaB [Hyphomicrobium sp.]|nr:tRNA (adenosine(37)-N6)-threonylcarbamoyltransferase complex dimerization subunit type 1 TsaB [Hyphomicrobium sp.]